MPREGSRLTPERLRPILRNRRLEDLVPGDLTELLRREAELADPRPEPWGAVDPRSGEPVLFAPNRAERPYDPSEDSSGGDPSEDSAGDASPPRSSPDCSICRGRTTGVVDVAPLSDGFTFVNMNLYPAVFPFTRGEVGAAASAEGRGEGPRPVVAGEGGDGAGSPGMGRGEDGRESGVGEAGSRHGYHRPAPGIHLLHWTSSRHDLDWPDLPLSDRRVVLDRLALLEATLLAEAELLFGRPAGPPDGPAVVVLKNSGRGAGASLTHGHHHVVLAPLPPRRVLEDHRFRERHGEPFEAWLLRENPSALTVRDYGAARLVVPFFMHRPLDMVLLPAEPGARRLWELGEAERDAWAAALGDAMGVLRRILRERGVEPAFNVLFHGGAGLYAELLPRSQGTAALERLGLSIADGRPAEAAARLREGMAVG